MSMNDQEFLIQKIRSQYTEKEHSELDDLKALDMKVRRAPTTFAYVFGSISAIVMGSGMSLVMTDIGSILGISNPMIPGILIGIVGLGLSLLTYPIYKGMLNRRKKKYAPQILALSERIMNHNN